MAYRGRFAPSPTGPLHVGSLLTAVGSFLDAKSQAGEWLVRIEDTDTHRTLPDAERSILSTLEAYGLFWDLQVTHQSNRIDRYNEVIEELKAMGRAYPCTCTRSELQKRKALRTYDRQCLATGAQANRTATVRFKASEQIHFRDSIQLNSSDSTQSDTSDFILYRRDAIIAYHLAVVVDDFDQGINQVVRGSDLLSETQKHLQLQRALDFPSPSYAHLPIVLADNKKKLSKQNGAQAISTEERQICQNLNAALTKLGQNPPKELLNAHKFEILDWGIKHWDRGKVSQTLTTKNEYSRNGLRP